MVTRFAFKKRIGKNDFSVSEEKLLRYKRLGYNLEMLCDSLHAYF